MRKHGGKSIRLGILCLSSCFVVFSLQTAKSQHPTHSASGGIVSSPANSGLAAEGMLAPYWARAAQAQQTQPNSLVQNELIPPEFVPWWNPIVVRPTQTSTVFIALDGLLEQALIHSPYIHSISAEPMIRDSYLCEESAAFDWNRFFETSYDDFNDPVGNALTTGNAEDRFKDKNWRANGGVRRTNPLGGQIEINQRLGAQRNNSRFLDPNPQGTARLELNYTHPLKNGAGRSYNRSRIVLARIDSEISRDELSNLIQEHLLQVTIAYWDLYRTRTRYVQRLMLLRSAEEILQKLAGREEVDALYRQILRAKAAVARRRSEIARAITQIDNTEAQLRVLVNDPGLISTAELTPLMLPFTAPINISLSDSLTTALTNRRDVSQAIRVLQSSSVRLGMARNELLPKLDLLMSSYVAGLEGDSRVFSSWSNQFAEGRPGFSVGILWELPRGNRAAKAREQRRRWELQKASSQFENTVQTSLTEVEIAVREVSTAYQEMVGKYHAMVAATNETAFLSDRYELLPGISDSAPLLLEDLLDAQERQADEEAALVDAQVYYSISLISLRQAMGTLLQADAIDNQMQLSSTRPNASVEPQQPQGPSSWEELQLPQPAPVDATPVVPLPIHPNEEQPGDGQPRERAGAAAGRAQLNVAELPQFEGEGYPSVDGSAVQW